MAQILQGKQIVLGVTGGIAAYKSAELTRRLKDRDADVQVVMTAGAQQFITPLTFQALSGRPVRTDLWDAAAEAAMGHIELARWPQRIVIAPATADFIARIAHGLNQLVDNGLGRRQVRIAHAEVNDIGTLRTGRSLEAVDLLKNVRRQPADFVKLFHHSRPFQWIACSGAKSVGAYIRIGRSGR